MPAVVVGDSSLVFGTTDETWGFIQNLAFADNSQVTEALDADGDVLGAAFSQNKTDVTGTYLFKAALNSPAANVGNGTPITLTDSDSPGNIFISEATTNKTNSEFKSIDFTGTHWPNLGT